MATNVNVGRLGEKIAEDYLLKKEYIILTKNFRYGKTEIDIIAKKGNKISFIEVKTRIEDAKGKPYEAVTYRKLQHVRMTAEYYILKNNLKNYKLSIDVISILLKEDLTVEKLQFFEGI